MRVLALIFASLGAAGAGFVGLIWNDKMKELDGQIQQLRAEGELNKDARSAEAIKDVLARVDYLKKATYGLIAAIPLGVIGGVLALSGRGKIAALVLATAYAVPLALLAFGVAVPDTDLVKVPALFAAGLPVAALLSLFIRPGIPHKAPPRRPDISRDDDIVG